MVAHCRRLEGVVPVLGTPMHADGAIDTKGQARLVEFLSARDIGGFWALGTGSSPLSGSNLAICVRYQIAVREMLRWNLPYAVLGWCCCGAVLALHARLG